MAASSSVSDGKTSIFSRFTDAGCRPWSSQKFHIPMNSRRDIGEHSAICAEVQNSGFVVRMRAISDPACFGDGPDSAFVFAACGMWMRARPDGLFHLVAGVVGAAGASPR